MVEKRKQYSRHGKHTR